ncbi:MAG: zinc ribbon domain-containing protein [Clostridia bacterium]|nr:zinc ribbon domain-containing protein [Clostridia bacterium]
METNNTVANVQETVKNKNLTACKTCGAEIAKTAKICPSCGAKNKKKPIALIIIIAAIIITIVSVYIIKIMDFNAVKATLTVNGTSYSWSEYKNLYHDYYLNGKSIEFQDEFTPATAEISGKITKISDAIIGETMNGNLPSKSTMKKYTITIDDGCTYNVKYGYYDQANYDFSHLAVGDKVTVKGTVTEESLFPTNRIEEYLDAQLEIEGTLDGIKKN